MSVLIKGMNKPKKCRRCDFKVSNCYCRINHGGIDRYVYSCDKQCPMVELPDKHGALIDVGSLLSKFNESDSDSEADRVWLGIVRRIIENEPIIIEAEGME